MSTLLKSPVGKIFLVLLLISPTTLAVSHAQRIRPRVPDPNYVAPQGYDSATVIKLIDDIENRDSREELLDAYFMSGTPRILPLLDGFEILTGAANSEKIGTRKWLCYRKVLGVAGILRGGDMVKQPLRPYAEILAHRKLLLRKGYGPLLGETVVDFIKFAVHSNVFGESGQQIDVLLPQIFDLHLELLRRGVYTSLDEAWIMYAYRSPKLDLLNWADKAVADRANRKKFGILRFAALLNEPLDPAKSLPVLEKIRPLAARQERTPAISYYRSLVSILLRYERFPEAKNAVLEMINATDAGRDLLIDLYVKTGETEAITRLVQQCKRQVISDEDAQLVSGVLISPEAQHISHALRAIWTEDLLRSYLASDKKRKPAAELQASLDLSSLLKSRQSSRAEARAVLENVSKKLEPLSGEARSLFARVQSELKYFDKPPLSAPRTR